MPFYCKYIFIIYVALLISCNKADEFPPQITIKGNDTIYSVLNDPYIDPGTTAWDDTDGDISKNVKITSNININKVGFYQVFFDAIDKAGNQALQKQRTVCIKHSAAKYTGIYAVADTVFYPIFYSLFYNSEIAIDSSVNNRIIINQFISDSSYTIHFDISENTIIFPYQEVGSTNGFNSQIFIQGSGIINDTTITFSYIRTSDDTTRLCRQKLIKSSNYR